MEYTIHRETSEIIFDIIYTSHNVQLYYLYVLIAQNKKYKLNQQIIFQLTELNVKIITHITL